MLLFCQFKEFFFENRIFILIIDQTFLMLLKVVTPFLEKILFRKCCLRSVWIKKQILLKFVKKKINK